MTQSHDQLSSTLADLSVELGGLPLPLDQLCGGTLVCGMTGSGKTVSVVNPLALQLAALEAANPARKPAIVYFALKGQPHRQFLEALPPERLDDVVTISHESETWLSLFHAPNWRSDEELNGAVVRFVEEFAQHFSDDLGGGRHDPYWERQRVRYLNTLSGLRTKKNLSPAVPEVQALNSVNALERLLARVAAFLDYCTMAPPETARKRGLSPADDSPLEEPEPRPFSRLGCLHDALFPGCQAQLNSLVVEFTRMADSTKFSILADIRGVVDAFTTPETGRFLFGPKYDPMTIERIVDEGKILIVNLPPADGGNTSLSTLLAIKLALFGRNTAMHEGHPVARRPVCVVIDEFQNLVSKGRTGGEDLMMAQCREHGVLVLMATQSLSLLAGALRSDAKLAALVANCRTKVFGRNGDQLTNQIASMACGRGGLQKVRRAPIWHGGEQFRAFVTETAGGDTPVVGADEFDSLQTGQFLVSTADGGTYRLDLRHRLTGPRLQTLKSPSPSL
jgi:hypothetical protein